MCCHQCDLTDFCDENVAAATSQASLRASGTNNDVFARVCASPPLRKLWVTFLNRHRRAHGDSESSLHNPYALPPHFSSFFFSFLRAFAFVSARAMHLWLRPRKSTGPLFAPAGPWSGYSLTVHDPLSHLKLSKVQNGCKTLRQGEMLRHHLQVWDELFEFAFYPWRLTCAMIKPLILSRQVYHEPPSFESIFEGAGERVFTNTTCTSWNSWQLETRLEQSTCS